MSLTSSLYSAISGLSATGDSMQIIGDNISNTNTTGFKSSSCSFQDLLSQVISTQSGTAQIGRGTAISDVSTNWSRGSFETTDNSTDLAISGDGFFIVQDTGTQTAYYTRAGEFGFDDYGNLINSSGYIVQGWGLNEDGDAIGAVTDITLDSWTSPPQESSEMTLIVNLNADSTSKTDDTAGLQSAWDGTDADGDGVCIAAENYEYQTAVTVFDSLGNTHDVTVYFDINDTTGEWEYNVTCNPDEDNRAATNGTALDGLLAIGTLSFSEDSGEITGMTMQSWDDGTSTWADETVNSSGYFEFTCDFLGGGSTETPVALDFGTRLNGTTWENDGQSSTQYASESSTTYRDADGYGAGSLEAISVDTDGTITGSYSNGTSIPLFQIALADFVNVDGLNKLGGSLYSETSESGAATTNSPGTNGLGSISPNSLEKSNVDIATEFVKMIEIQRSYQANSKIITTVDDMLSNTISMKR